MIVADSYMAMVLPDDISQRIAEFIAGRRSFPFIECDELVCMMYLYGKDGRVSDKEVEEVRNLAQRTAASGTETCSGT